MERTGRQPVSMDRVLAAGSMATATTTKSALPLRVATTRAYLSSTPGPDASAGAIQAPVGAGGPYQRGLLTRLMGPMPPALQP